MDILTHIFIPLIFLYSIRKLEREYILLIPFTLFPDLDKFIGTPLLHSLVVEFGIFLIFCGIECFIRKDVKCRYSMIAIAYILSHLIFDIFDGGPVYLLYPFVDVGVGLEFPMKLVIGNGIEFKDVVPKVVYTTPHNVGEYGGVVSGFGFIAMFTFLLMILYEYRFKVKRPIVKWNIFKSYKHIMRWKYFNLTLLTVYKTNHKLLLGRDMGTHALSLLSSQITHQLLHQILSPSPTISSCLTFPYKPLLEL